MLARRVSAAALALLPLAAACGEPSRVVANPSHATRAPEPTVNPTVFPSRTPSPVPATGGPATGGPTATGTPGSPGPGAVGNAVDATADNKFQPAVLNVKVGTEVVWTNTGGFHTVTGGTGPANQDTSVLDGRLDATGATYTVKFTKPGKYPYFCQPHESIGMKGEVVVA